MHGMCACVYYIDGRKCTGLRVLPFQMKNLLTVNQITPFHLDLKLLPSTPAAKQGEKGTGSISRGKSGN